MPECSAEGCDKPAKGRGMCWSHYRKYKLEGGFIRPRSANGAPLHFMNDLSGFVGEDCVIWPYARDETGYAVFRNPGGSNLATRYVCERASGPAPTPKHEAAHSCGNGSLGCVNPNHLRWATRAENQADRALHGTANRGERQGRSTMKEPDVLALRARYANGERLCDLARSSGFKVDTIEAAVKGRSWKWLSDNPRAKVNPAA